MKTLFFTIILALSQKLVTISSQKYHQIQAVTSTKNNDFISAVHLIVEKVFLKKFMTLKLITTNLNDRKIHEFRALLMKRNESCCLYCLDNHTLIVRNSKGLRNINLILLDKLSAFEVFFKSITPEVFSFRGYFLVAFVHGKLDNYEEIFRLMWQKNIINVNVIFEHESAI